MKMMLGLTSRCASAADSDDVEDGTLTLVFSERPFTLRQWQVLDAQGTLTTVTLNNARTGMALDEQLPETLEPMSWAADDNDDALQTHRVYRWRAQGSIVRLVPSASARRLSRERRRLKRTPVRCVLQILSRWRGWVCGEAL